MPGPGTWPDNRANRFICLKSSPFHVDRTNRPTCGAVDINTDMESIPAAVGRILTENRNHKYMTKAHTDDKQVDNKTSRQRLEHDMAYYSF